MWLGTLGPSATWAWQRLARIATTRAGLSIDTADLTVSLGLGDSLSRNAKMSRTLSRLIAFDAAHLTAETLAVRVALPDVTERQTAQLSPSARFAHDHLARPGHRAEHKDRRPGGRQAPSDNRRRRRGEAVTSPINAAKARHPIADVARRTGIAVPDGRGSSVTVRCPMPAHGHPGRTPSLRLYLDVGRWYCFGCSSRAGDVVEWVTQSEGVAWRQAIDIVDSHRPLTNAWAGDNHERLPDQAPSTVEGPERPDLTRTPTRRVQAALDVAWAKLSTGPSHDQASTYLASRGIDLAILEAHTERAEASHTISRRHLIDSLTAEGFHPDELVDAGLAHRRPGPQLTDYYQHRVLLPVRDPEGRLTGLIGRNIGNPRWPKYTNPPRTRRYDKSVNLYQPLPAPLSPDGHVVVVEGTLDAMAIAVAALRRGEASHFCPITQSGKTLSDAQLRHVVQLHPNPPVIAFDSDPAGRESTRRLAMAAAISGVQVLVSNLPDGHDPASWLTLRGPDGLGIWTTGRPMDRRQAESARPCAAGRPPWTGAPSAAGGLAPALGDEAGVTL